MNLEINDHFVVVKGIKLPNLKQSISQFGAVQEISSEQEIYDQTWAGMIWKVLATDGDVVFAQCIFAPYNNQLFWVDKVNYFHLTEIEVMTLSPLSVKNLEPYVNKAKSENIQNRQIYQSVLDQFVKNRGI